jgi:hypothetical protein
LKRRALELLKFRHRFRNLYGETWIRRRQPRCIRLQTISRTPSRRAIPTSSRSFALLRKS